MTIQWFPGHMTRARRQIQDKLKLIDVVIELLDARLPVSSRNPMIDEILLDKPRMILLNKSDLADAKVTQEWIEYFKKKELPPSLWMPRQAPMLKTSRYRRSFF